LAWIKPIARRKKMDLNKESFEKFLLFLKSKNKTIPERSAKAQKMLYVFLENTKYSPTIIDRIEGNPDYVHSELLRTVLGYLNVYEIDKKTGKIKFPISNEKKAQDLHREIWKLWGEFITNTTGEKPQIELDPWLVEENPYITHQSSSHPPLDIEPFYKSKIRQLKEDMNNHFDNLSPTAKRGAILSHIFEICEMIETSFDFAIEGIVETMVDAIDSMTFEENKES
jgi:hypothetical protein